MFSYIYNSLQREELATFARSMAQAIAPALTRTNPLPVVVCLRGDKDAGKTLFWDETRNELLGTSARIDRHFSQDLTTGDRIYETWNGFHRTTGDPLKIFFCNMDSLYFDIEDDQHIRRQIYDLRTDERDPRRFGDLLLLSNRHVDASCLDIKVQKPTRSMSKMRSEWDRKTTLTIHETELAETPEFKKFMRGYFETPPIRAL
jgi:hypothetical protein